MPAGAEIDLVAVVLPPPEAAVEVRRLLDAGEAFCVLRPDAPSAALTGLAPTVIIDAEGRRRLPGGVPVSAGVAAVVATTGTTGAPKLVELTRAGLEASAAALHAGDHTWVGCLPLERVAGLAVVARAHVSGSTALVHDTFDIEALRAAAGAGGCAVSLVPTMLVRLLRASVPVGGFALVLLGGGFVDEGLLAEARAAGAPVVATYGLTETWGGVVHDGRPLPGVDVRLAGDGEIEVRGAMTMRAYRHDPAGTNAAFTLDGYLRTGDLGRLDGRLRVVDRKGDMIKTGGVPVAPVEVEQVLARHPGVADVCVAGRPDPEWGERVVAFVVPADPRSPPLLDELRLLVLARMPAAAGPRELVLVDAIPRTEGGKALRRQLRG